MKLKMAETNKTTDDGINSLTYGLMVAFATKTWKLPPSISHYVQLQPISEARLAIIHPNNPRTHCTQNCVHSSCVEKEILHAYTKQRTESYVNIYLCIFLPQIIIIYIQVVTETEGVGWVMEGTLCAEDYTFFYRKINYIFRTGFFIHQSTVLAVKAVELLSDRMSHIVMRGCRWELVLIVHAPTGNINYDAKDNFYEEFEQMFDHFPTYHMQILLECSKAKFGRRYFQANSWEISVCIQQTIEKTWERIGAVNQLLDFMKTYNLFRWKVLNNSLIEFGINIWN
jgi:hypothetical protein